MKETLSKHIFSLLYIIFTQLFNIIIEGMLGKVHIFLEYFLLRASAYYYELSRKKCKRKQQMNTVRSMIRIII